MAVKISIILFRNRLTAKIEAKTLYCHQIKIKIDDTYQVSKKSLRKLQRGTASCAPKRGTLNHASSKGWWCNQYGAEIHIWHYCHFNKQKYQGNWNFGQHWFVSYIFKQSYLQNTWLPNSTKSNLAATGK